MAQTKDNPIYIMYAKPFLLSLAVFCTVFSYSQSYVCSSAEAIGRAGTGTAIDNTSAVFINPSGIAKQKGCSFSANYLLPYSTKELSVCQFSCIVPVGVGTVFSVARKYGSDFYSENQLSLGFAKSLSPFLRASFQLQYFQICQILENASQLYSSIGVQADLLKGLTFGVFVSNPEQSVVHFSEKSIKINSFFRVGLLWKASDTVLVLYELEKVSGISMFHYFGFDYRLNKSMSLRCGVLGKPIHYSLGSSVHIGRFKCDIGMMVHQVLGVSSSFGLTYHFNS